MKDMASGPHPWGKEVPRSWMRLIELEAAEEAKKEMKGIKGRVSPCSTPSKN